MIENRQGKVLIVDDDKANDDILSAHLRQLGFAVTVTNDGRYVLDVMRIWRVDLVLLSLKLPEMDCYRILQDLKADGALPYIPIIVLADTGQMKIVEQCIKLGADDCWFEPYNSVLLKARVNTFVQKSKLREISARLSVEKKWDRLLERIVIEAKSACNAHGATLYLCEDNYLKATIIFNDSPNIEGRGNTETNIIFPPLRLFDKETNNQNMRHIATSAALLGRTVSVPDIYNSGDFGFSGVKIFDPQNEHDGVSSLALPLKNYDDNVIGVLHLLNARDSQTGEVIAFDSYMRQIVEILSSQAAVALNNQILFERQKNLLRYERELQIGQEIQATFLPSTVPQPAGWEIATYFNPAREVSGDFYDVLYLNDQKKVIFVIADVCDKGVGAALFMALIRSLIRAIFQFDTPRRIPLQHVVQFTSDYIVRNHIESGMFATLFIGVIDLTTHSLTYVNGGHNPPVVIGPEGVKTLLKPTGPAVGLLPGIEFSAQNLNLDPGDVLFVFTDGVSEACDPHGNLFTDRRLLAILEQEISSAAELTERIQKSVCHHIGSANQSDDITMMAIRREPTSLGSVLERNLSDENLPSLSSSGLDYLPGYQRL